MGKERLRLSTQTKMKVGGEGGTKIVDGEQKNSQPAGATDYCQE